MKNYTVRLSEEQQENLERIQKVNGLTSAQATFEHMTENYETMVKNFDYWLMQHENLAAEYKALTEKTDAQIQVLKDLIIQLKKEQ